MSAGRTEPLVHHELCFGCGRANLFGLLLELQRCGERRVTGRCFVKQDHQGAQPGIAHEGIIAAALSEAMSFAAGPNVRPAAVEVSLGAPVPVGAYVDIEAWAIDARTAQGTAGCEGKTVATARGSYEHMH